MYSKRVRLVWVDLGSLKDTVPADRIVVLRGGWTPFGNASAGEILLRLTYKAYVEDEEDDRSEKVSSSEDELSDSDEPNVTTSEQREKEYIIESDKESFMDVLAALLVSEEFRGIVASETVNTKSSDAGINASASEPDLLTVGSRQQISAKDSGSSQGTTLFWLTIITSISVLIAINMGGTSLFILDMMRVALVLEQRKLHKE
ncbi:UNVERIFIED_CONTAM: hypothetical protein Scaly_2719500 [Sesamum calycinum]|uniref:Uncharacterized protein n=1 Tax=Sesamum calycinum TaxID=2727403 RepID=A0AAW2J499_9LAMI